MTDQWGEWIKHNGKGYPAVVIGMKCQVIDYCSVKGPLGVSEPFMCLGKAADGGSWNWADLGTTNIMAYRVAKPKGMECLEEHLRYVEKASIQELIMAQIELDEETELASVLWSEKMLANKGDEG